MLHDWMPIRFQRLNLLLLSFHACRCQVQLWQRMRYTIHIKTSEFLDKPCNASASVAQRCNCEFPDISHYISEMVQTSTKVTTEYEYQDSLEQYYPVPGWVCLAGGPLLWLICPCGTHYLTICVILTSAEIDWLSMVLRLRQHNIIYTADGFYRSDDPTNSVKALKEGG